MLAAGAEKRFLAPGNTCLYILRLQKNARRRRRKNIRNACVDEDVGGRDGVLEDELPTIIVLALVTDSESDLDVSVVRERVKKGILFFHHFSWAKVGCFVSTIG